MRFLLLAVLFVPTRLAYNYIYNFNYEPGLKYCYDYHMDETANITERDDSNRVVLIKQFLTYESLDCGVPLTEEVEQHIRDRESCGDNDVIGLLVDEALGGSGNDKRNAILFNTASHVIWKHKVTEPVYTFLRENRDLNVMFEVELFYDDDNTTRPFFLGVRHKYCRDRFTGQGYPDSSVEQYVVKGFLPNPRTAETVEPYLYRTRLAKEFKFDVSRRLWFERIAMPLDHYNETMEKMYRRLFNKLVVHNEDGDHITRLEMNQKTVNRRVLKSYRELVNETRMGWAWPIRSLWLSKSQLIKNPDNKIRANPKARDELERGIMPPILKFLSDPLNERHEVAVVVNMLFKDNLTITPSGFLVQATILVDKHSRWEITSGCPEIPIRSFIKN